jgi:glycosyltransferase involved in cell wall biosynthesis
MKLKPKVMIMVPAYNEEMMVGEIVKSTLAQYPDFKVVVINDGSEDSTAEVSKAAGAEVVSLPFHCGGGPAIQTGYLVAERHNYDYVVKIDADGQHKPEQIKDLLNPLFEDEAEITVGSRYLNTTDPNDSVMKDSGRVFSSTLLSMLRKIEVTDITSGMRGWSKKAIRTLLPIYMERKITEDSVFWIVETIIASRVGLRMKEVPIEVLPRQHGESKSFSRRKMLAYPVKLLTTLLQESGRRGN